MTAYQIRWDTEIDGTSAEDAAAQAVAFMRERTGRVTLFARPELEDAHWEPVVVSVPAGE